ncbi:MAG: hypothetical protein ACM31C_09515 [Acidobacteriota bacterium]
MRLRRTTTADPGFRTRVTALDAELRDTYGELQAQYAPVHQVETIATAVGLFVVPGHRQRGVASAVIAELEARAR